jgi:hypothetical protein
MEKESKRTSTIKDKIVAVWDSGEVYLDDEKITDNIAAQTWAYDGDQPECSHVSRITWIVELIEDALDAADIPLCGIVPFALALLGLETSGYRPNEVPPGYSPEMRFNAKRFHQAVMRIAPLAFADKRAPTRGATCSYDPDGFRQDDIVDDEGLIGADRRRLRASGKQGTCLS